MSEAGITDGELLRTTAIEKSSPTLLQVPEALIEGEFVVFSHEPIDLANGWESLSGKSVGIIIGMKIVENNVPENALVTKVKGEKQLFTLLAKKRIDYAVFLRDMGRYYLYKNNMKGLVISEMALDRVPAYVYLHPKHKALVPQLASALKEMKQDGSFQLLVEKHLHSIRSDNTAEGINPEYR